MVPGQLAEVRELALSCLLIARGVPIAVRCVQTHTLTSAAADNVRVAAAACVGALGAHMTTGDLSNMLRCGERARPPGPRDVRANLRAPLQDARHGGLEALA